MHRASIFLFFLIAAGLAGCGEPAARPDPEGQEAYNSDPGPSPMRERTLKQGEPR
jgi:hypothetical protein